MIVGGPSLIAPDGFGARTEREICRTPPAPKPGGTDEHLEKRIPSALMSEMGGIDGQVLCQEQMAGCDKQVERSLKAVRPNPRGQTAGGSPPAPAQEQAWEWAAGRFTRKSVSSKTDVALRALTEWTDDSHQCPGVKQVEL